MISLNDSIWQTPEGGYRQPYDASVALRRLEQNHGYDNAACEELWNELHHQGDVGLASYLALPQLAKIISAKETVSWNMVALCCVIAQQMHAVSNPALPPQFQSYYQEGLQALKTLVLEQLRTELPRTDQLVALSAIVTCSGQHRLGKAILEFEDEDVLDQFLEQF